MFGRKKIPTTGQNIINAKEQIIKLQEEGKIGKNTELTVLCRDPHKERTQLWVNGELGNLPTEISCINVRSDLEMLWELAESNTQLKRNATKWYVVETYIKRLIVGFRGPALREAVAYLVDLIGGEDLHTKIDEGGINKEI